MMSSHLLIPKKIFPNNLDIIRFSLATSVIFCHSFAIYLGYDKFKITEPFMIWSHQQISIGTMAVDLFFVISGCLILKSFSSSKTTIDYLQKRVLRIYPGFIVAILASLIFAGFWGSGNPYTWDGYFNYLNNLNLIKEFIHLTTLQSPYQRVFFIGFPEPGLNDSVWTIQFEFVCYLLLPLFALLVFIKKKWFFLIAFSIAYLIVLLQLNGFIFPYSDKKHLFFGNPYFHPKFIMYFLAGACFYNYRNYVPRYNILAVLSFIAVIISFAFIKCIDQVLPIAGSYLLFHFAFNQKIPFGNFAKYGDFSYGVYLYAWPIQALVNYFFYSHIGPYKLFMISTPLTLIAAFVSWHLVEKPFLKLKDKKGKQPLSSTSVATKQLN